jgi:NRPS condensation-like uncharacterized protein
MSFYRTPSPLEFSYIGMDQPPTSIMVNQFLSQGSGTIDKDKLTDALRQAADANPGIKLRLKGFWGWRYWDDQGAYPVVEEIDAPDWDGMSSEHCPRLGQYIDVRKDPLCQASIIYAKQDVYLLFRTHHAITDGRGTVHFLMDAFRIMRGEQPVGSASKLTEWDIAMREERPPRPVAEGDCLAVTPFPSRPHERGCRWQRFVWNGDKNKLTAKIMFALAQLAWENNGEGKVLIRIPADLRRYLKDDEGITVGNCSGALDFEVKPDSSLNQIRSQLVKAMRNKEDLSPFEEKQKIARWLPPSMFRNNPAMLHRTHEQRRYRMTAIITNLGDVDLTPFTLTTYQPKELFGVPIGLENRPVYVGAASQGNDTGIMVGIPKALADQAQLQQFCEALGEKLHSLK